MNKYNWITCADANTTLIRSEVDYSEHAEPSKTNIQVRGHGPHLRPNVFGCRSLHSEGFRFCLLDNLTLNLTTSRKWFSLIWEIISWWSWILLGAHTDWNAWYGKMVRVNLDDVYSQTALARWASGGYYASTTSYPKGVLTRKSCVPKSMRTLFSERHISKLIGTIKGSCCPKSP